MHDREWVDVFVGGCSRAWSSDAVRSLHAGRCVLFDTSPKRATQQTSLRKDS